MVTIHHDMTPEGDLIYRPVGELDAFTVSQFRQAFRMVVSLQGAERLARRAPRLARRHQ